MWLSRPTGKNWETEAGAELGSVTLDGERPGVYLSGERRNLPVIGPGGYRWRPALGEEVLVLKTGREGERPCVLGTGAGEETQLQPGEVSILTPEGDASIRWGIDGTLHLTGRVVINGVPLPDTYQPKTPVSEGEI